MKYQLKVHHEIEEDLIPIYSWYENKEEGIGEEFYELFYSSLDLIEDFPLLNPIRFEDYHNFTMHKYPYSIYYIIESNLIIIMGVYHQSRDPKNIKEKLTNRKSNI